MPSPVVMPADGSGSDSKTAKKKPGTKPYRTSLKTSFKSSCVQFRIQQGEHLFLCEKAALNKIIALLAD